MHVYKTRLRDDDEKSRIIIASFTVYVQVVEYAHYARSGALICGSAMWCQTKNREEI